MSSSQGVNADTVSGYPFDITTLRDASDWIKYKKQSRVYQVYGLNSPPSNETTNPVWDKYGNNFKLDFNHGQFDCGNCQGSAFTGYVIESTVLANCYTAAPEGVTCIVDLTGITFDGTGDPGHRYENKFTLEGELTTISFGFSNAGCSNINLASHIQFDTYDVDVGGVLTAGDFYTITNPSYGPAGTFVEAPPGTREILYDNNTFNLTTTSVITLTATNPLSIISFSIN